MSLSRDRQYLTRCVTMLGVMIMILIMSPGTEGCPELCDCSEKTTVSCSTGKLTEVPPLPPGTKELYVSHNIIHSLPSDGLQELQVLDLSKNKLNTSLSASYVFPEMKNLAKLFLRANGLRAWFHIIAVGKCGVPQQFYYCHYS
ncbi:leucine-rich repeat-containing protein 15-like [Arapaima gigas]